MSDKKWRIEDFESYSLNCPYFYSHESSIIGDGYNCNHKDCGDVEDGVGRFFTFSCPLVPTAELKDFQDQEIDLNGFVLDDFEEDSYILVPLLEKVKE